MKRVLANLLVLLLVLSISPVYCYAADSQGFLFAAEMVPPINQIGKAGHYHIPGESGEQITLQTKLTNHTDQSLEIKVVSMNAYSSQSGIFYQSPHEVNTQEYTLLDDRYGLAQYMSVPDPITLLPNQTEVVSFSVTVPDLNTGTMLGCIRFIAFAGTQELQEANDQNGNAQMLIDKYQAIDTAVQIDLPQKAEPSVTVDDPIFSGDKIAVSIKIINQAAIIQENVTGFYEILDSEKKVLFESNIESFKMAPMAEFLYPLAWQNETLEAGSYSLSLTLNVSDEEIAFSKPFTINSLGIQEAQKTQQRVNPEIKSNYPQWYEVVLQLFVLLFIILLIRHLRRKKR